VELRLVLGIHIQKAANLVQFHNLAMYARGVCGMWHWPANQNNWIFMAKSSYSFELLIPNALLTPHSDHQGEFLSCNAKVQDDHLCDPAHMQARIVEKH
jgi:hypothetical protein